jgi:hypothetical protein
MLHLSYSLRTNTIDKRIFPHLLPFRARIGQVVVVTVSIALAFAMLNMVTLSEFIFTLFTILIILSFEKCSAINYILSGRFDPLDYFRGKFE